MNSDHQQTPMPMAMRSKGRSQLRGVLDELVLQRRDGRDQSEEHIVVTSEDEAHQLEDDEYNNNVMDPLSSHRELGKRRAKCQSLSSKKKRLKKTVHKESLDGSDSGEDPGHRPYVMTVFDRKVDLARFDDDTPLYAMCREWMLNNPRKSLLENGTAGTQNGTGNGNGDGTGGGTGNRNGTETGNDGQEVGGKETEFVQKNRDVYRLPKPHLSDRVQPDVIPKPLPYGSMEELETHLKQPSSSIESCRKQNIQRWKETRLRWKRATYTNQQRYRESLQILRDLFHRSQRDNSYY